MDIKELQSRFHKVVTAAADLLETTPSPRNQSLPQAYSEFQKCCQLLTLQIETAERNIEQQAAMNKQGKQPVSTAQDVQDAAAQLSQEIQTLSK
jgi:hypothetical protein